MPGSAAHGRFSGPRRGSRFEGGVASQYLHGLPLRSKVGFRLTRGDVKPAQHSYPFEGKQTFSLLCTASGLPPMLQALQRTGALTLTPAPS